MISLYYFPILRADPRPSGEGKGNTILGGKEEGKKATREERKEIDIPSFLVACLSPFVHHEERKGAEKKERGEGSSRAPSLDDQDLFFAAEKKTKKEKRERKSVVGPFVAPAEGKRGEEA